MNGNAKKFKMLYMVFGLLGTALIVATYFLPIWWVALQSIQYPKAMYPKGIRIEFKYDGVYNGCKGVREREELAMDAGADCLIEMNKINHFIGMYPIVQGVNDVDELGNHVKYPVYAGDSMPESKLSCLQQFPIKFEKFSNIKILNEKVSLIYVILLIIIGLIALYYLEGRKIIFLSLAITILIFTILHINAIDLKDGTVPCALKLLDAIMRNGKYVFVLLGLLGLLFVFVDKKKLTWAAVLTALTPFYFLIIYVYYLYWYGHHLGLHGGGAFNGIKPFMPTVFGEGKVAQFTTMSYPYIGFFVGLAGFVLLILAINFKNKYFKVKQ